MLGPMSVDRRRPVAAVLALRGKKEIDQANPDLPVTQQTLKEDARWARTQKN